MRSCVRSGVRRVWATAAAAWTVGARTVGGRGRRRDAAQHQLLLGELAVAEEDIQMMCLQLLLGMD